MKLQANIDGHYVAVSVPAQGAWFDAAAVDKIAGLEMRIDGELRIGESESMRPNTLTIDMSPAQLRELGLVALEKSGAPALTEPEWRQVIYALRESAATTNRELADRIEQGGEW